MRRYRRLIIALALLPAFNTLYAQAVLTDDTIVLGDQTVVSVPLPAAGQVPAVGGPGIVVVRQTADTAAGALQTVVTSFEPGAHWLHVGSDDSLLLVVTDVEVDTANAEIRDIAPIERVPYTFWEIFRWVLLALAVAAAGVGVWWFVTHRRQVQQVLGLGEPVDTRTPCERATQALEALRDKHLWQNGQVKEYHTELTDTVRRFIEEATGIRATDMTSDETVEAVEHLGTGADCSLLKAIFGTADMVKFAKSEPLPHEHEASMASAERFVTTLWEQVKPIEEEVPHE
mgnify:CR=1 FL=1